MLLELNNIGKIYESNGVYTIGLRKVNLSFNYNEFVVIEGSSGAGKSTLLNIIGANDSYEEGELLFKGNTTSRFSNKEWDEYRKNISFIFQEYNIIDNLTVLENVMIALLRIPDSKQRKETAVAILEKVGLINQLNQKGSKLSGGEKQRCVIARALAKNSPIILADEPTGNLDVKSSKEIAHLLKQISNDKLVIVVTHNPEFFNDYASRKITVDDGKITKDEILEKKDNPNNDTNDENPTTLSKKQQLKNLLYLASLNYKSRPKFSIMLSLIFIITAITFLFLTSIFQNNFIRPIKQNVKNNPISGKVIISKNSKPIHIKGYEKMIEELNKHSKKGKIKYSFFDEKLTDFTITQPETSFNDVSKVTINVLFDPYRYNLKDNEMVLKIPYSKSHCIAYIKQSFINLNIGIKTIKVVKTVNNDKISVYLSENTLKEHGKLVKSLHSSIKVNDENINIFSFIIDNELTTGKVKIININRYQIDNKKVIFNFNLSKSYEIINSNQKDETGLVRVALCESDYNELFKNEDFSSEIALYFPSDFVAKKVLPKLNEQGLLTILTTSAAYTSQSSRIYQTNLLFYLLMFASILFFAVLISLIFIKSVKIYNYDFAIYKTLAISQSTIKKSLLLQMLYVYIPQFFVLPLVSLIVAIVPNTPFKFISLLNFGIIEIIILLIALLVNFFFNKTLSRGSINIKIKGDKL